MGRYPDQTNDLKQAVRAARQYPGGNGKVGAIGGSSSGGSVAVADVNHDGNPDLLVANEGTGTVGVLLGNGDGTLPACRDLRVKETT